MARRLRCAAIQVQSQVGRLERNLTRTESWLQEALDRKVELALLPELQTCGYAFDRELWKHAETAEGPTVQWVCDRAAKYNLWLGCGFLEACAGHFYSTYALASTRGKIATLVRKSLVTGAECHLLRGSESDRVLKTELGRVGILLGYELHHTRFLQRMIDEQADVILLAHTTPKIPGLADQPREEYVKLYKALPRHIAKWTGIPVVTCNKFGRWSPAAQGGPDGEYLGLSTIADSDGQHSVQMGDEEGLLALDVWLDPQRKSNELPPKTDGEWLFKVPPVCRKPATPSALGGLRYTLSPARRSAAQAAEAHPRELPESLAVQSDER